MKDSLRTHYSCTEKTSLLFSYGFPIRVCLLFAGILEGMSFDNIEKLSKAFVRFSNGHFFESDFKNTVKERVKNGKIQ